jgi:hypothetical protein
MRVNNYNYDLAKRISSLARDEFLKAPDVLDRQIKAFGDLTGYYMKLEKRHLIYEVGDEPSYFLRNIYVNGDNMFQFDIPAVDTDGTILMYGIRYLPIMQLANKPVFRNKKSHDIYLQTSLCDVVMSGARIKIPGVKETTLASIFFATALGKTMVENLTGIKYQSDGINFSKIKPNYDTKEFREAFGKYSDKEFNDLPGTLLWLTIRRLEAITRGIDLFNAQYLDGGSPALELLRSLAKYSNGVPVLPYDNKTLNSKRFKLYERFLMPITDFLTQKTRSILSRGPNSVAPGKKIISMSQCAMNVVEDSKVVSAMGFTNRDLDNALLSLTNTTRFTRSGKLGENVIRRKGRNINNTYYGTICPISTPEREGCGVIGYLCMSHKSYFNKMYKFPTEETK